MRGGWRRRYSPTPWCARCWEGSRGRRASRGAGNWAILWSDNTPRGRGVSQGRAGRLQRRPARPWLTPRARGLHAMPDQAEHWSRAADVYEKEFIDPYLPGVRNPLRDAIAALPDTSSQTVADSAAAS